MQAFTIFIRDLCFNCAHWLFAYEYYDAARLMPSVLKKDKVSQSEVKYPKTFFRVLLCLNIFIPFLEGLLDYVRNKSGLANYNGPAKPIWNILLVIVTFFNSMTQIFSVFTLGIAIFKIKKYLSETGNSGMLNTKILVIHLSAFGLFMFSILVFEISASFFVFVNQDKYKSAVLYSTLFATICSFIS